MELTEEDEFGMQKTTSRESDPMENERRSIIEDHPDFTVFDPSQIKEWMRSSDGASGPALPKWMKQLPIDKDPSKWTIMEVQIRPDRSWEVIKELLATVCMTKGLVLAAETPSSVLFRRLVAQDLLSSGIGKVSTYQNVYVRIGVLSSKLRVLDVACLVAADNNLLGGVVNVARNQLVEDRTLVWEYELGQLLGSIQSTIISQYLSLSHLFMASPENTSSIESVELDEGYVADVKSMFMSEMKENMRQVSIPLEEFAYEQEYACALLLGLLDPLLKKHQIKLIDHPSTEDTQNSDELSVAMSATTIGADSGKTANAVETEDKIAPTIKETNKEQEKSPGTSQCYGERVNAAVHRLWSQLQAECDQTVRQKIKEKRRQVTSRTESVQRLRAQAVNMIINSPDADVLTLKPSQRGNRDDVLLYEGSVIVSSVPAKLQVSYGYLVYRSMVPFFSATTTVLMSDIDQVVPTTALGIRVLSIVMKQSASTKSVTVAMGLEIDLLYQLLLEILSMRTQEPPPQSLASFVSQDAAVDITDVVDAVDEQDEAKCDAPYSPSAVDAIIAAEDAAAEQATLEPDSSPA
ncbi:TPA: hypothetical protein N0F65_011669 [Lagenidium giganteum]|uniref:Uncharacterized protein n=1 Tax=Lagenidium giganteum TaxID=4803 RepID=A0AAV2ZBI0_9STRA|nr:TPA: hypothetical protein N0F65_011669 [Lagenidium giganteum]